MDPESVPPSPKPQPRPQLDLEGAEYFAELARRIEGHLGKSVIGARAKREIGYAVEILRELGGKDAT